MNSCVGLGVDKPSSYFLKGPISVNPPSETRSGVPGQRPQHIHIANSMADIKMLQHAIVKLLSYHKAYHTGLSFAKALNMKLYEAQPLKI